MWHKFAICLCIKLSIVQGGPAVENGDLFSLINRNQLLLWRDQPFILCWGTLPGKCRLGLAISLNGRPVTLSVESIILYLIGDKWLWLANGIKNNSSFFFFFFLLKLYNWMDFQPVKLNRNSHADLLLEFSQKVSCKVAFSIPCSLRTSICIYRNKVNQIKFFLKNSGSFSF